MKKDKRGSYKRTSAIKKKSSDSMLKFYQTENGLKKKEVIRKLGKRNLGRTHINRKRKEK